jgi:hypothetical protein
MNFAAVFVLDYSERIIRSDNVSGATGNSADDRARRVRIHHAALAYQYNGCSSAIVNENGSVHRIIKSTAVSRSFDFRNVFRIFFFPVGKHLAVEEGRGGDGSQLERYNRSKAVWI